MLNEKDQKELLAIAHQVYIEEGLFVNPFNLTIESMESESASMRFTNRDSLLGSFRSPNLHGGAIATVLDTVGSLAVFSNMINKAKGESVLEKVNKLEKGDNRLSTVDMRIDYLRPGRGRSFLAKSWILRRGYVIAVTRMELYNDEQTLIAVGTGTYVV
jgi:acyl-coenzyme A thioesterase PaaI-like protein